MEDTRLLRNALTANAAFSLLSGLVLTLFAGPLADWLGIPLWIAVVFGIGLIGFAISVYTIARNPKPGLVRQVIVSDVAWVVGAGMLLVAFPDALSSEGRWALLVVTLVVADFALVQWLGLRKAEGNGVAVEAA